ncbi:hypothetical protein [Subtercola boreus]|uniref:DUF218 domain-containing protein n=1 Tax=Subtercola boreus TaxID=120213 RepID=A0A3E0W682_9MICO|nr:hypothetical protein [Subtercola boreus]RFA17961.1 hypothetical protein B7R24_14960 [Subtercola boreus]RFA18343.1 hypothetical protein B7R23_14995 [Subtercola boreus]RFA24872.1 hypothetical protein B7R25_14990 [Subtercola boreus]
MISVAADGEFSAANLPICTTPQPFAVYCETPDPFTTQGEARDLSALAAEHGWTSATVITFTPHVVRSRMIMERCFTGDLRMVADDTHLTPAGWAYEMLYQTGAFAKVLLDTGC